MSRRMVVWLFLVLTFGGLIAYSAASASDTSAVARSLKRNGISYSGTLEQDGGSGVRVAMVPITNTIVEGSSSADGAATGSDDVVRMLDAIADDADSWDGVILEMDTPGGSVIASEEITAALRRVKHAKIPVVAWMRGMAASAGYYISSNADQIVASPNTFTGSIGVILEYYVVAGLANKVGVSQVTIKSGKLKDIGNPMREPTAQERALFQGIIDQAYAQFVGVVAKGRDMSTEKVREIGDGRVYTGLQAKEIGLVDELGLREDAYDAMAKLIGKHGVHGEDLQVTSFSRSFGLLEMLSADAGSAFDSVSAAGDVVGAMHGDAAATRRVVGRAGVGAGSDEQRLGNGFAHLEYRAVVG